MGKIAITGAHSLLGQEVVRWVKRNGHSTVLIDHIDTASNSPDSRSHVVDIANDYDSTVRAFTGCDAVIHLAPEWQAPGCKPGPVAHMNNIQAAFNCFRACAELRIKRICYAASFNAVGLAFTNQFKHFPIDEGYPLNPVDAYALAQLEVEIQAKAFVRWYPKITIACLRVHALGSKDDVRKRCLEEWERSGVMDLWSWAHPRAVARACLSSVEQTGKLWAGCEVFNIAAPETTEERPSRELAEKYYPHVQIRDSLFGLKAERETKKAERDLGWKHFETE